MYSEQIRPEDHKLKESTCCVQEPTYGYVYKSSVVVNMVLFLLAAGTGYPVTLVDRSPMEYVGWGITGFFGLWAFYGLHLLMDFRSHVQQGVLAEKTLPFVLVSFGLGALIIFAAAVFAGGMIVLAFVEYNVKGGRDGRGSQDSNTGIVMIVVFLIAIGGGVITKSKSLKHAAEYITHHKELNERLEGPLVGQTGQGSFMERAK